MILTSLVVHFKVVCRNGSSQFCLRKFNAFMQAVPLLGGLASFAAVARELLSLQPDCCSPLSSCTGPYWCKAPPCLVGCGQQRSIVLGVLWSKMRTSSGGAEGELLLPLLVRELTEGRAVRDSFHV